MRVKKISVIVDNFPAGTENLSEKELKRREKLVNIRAMVDEGYKYQEIATTLGVSYKTVCRYKDCNPDERCRMIWPSRGSGMQNYKEEILQLIKDGYHARGIARKLQEEGCEYANGTIRTYVKQLANENGLELTKYKSGPTLEKRNEWTNNEHRTVLVKKKELIDYLWMDEPIDNQVRLALYEKYPIVQELKTCVLEFKQIFILKSMPRLYLFIERYKNSNVKELASFANSLERDIDAVENAVASPINSGFVEGNNNRVKEKKREMYGRCGIKLLSAKILLPYLM